MNDSTSIGQLANRGEMIAIIEIQAASNLLSLCVEALRYIIRIIAFFARLRVLRTPDKPLRTRYVSAIFFDNPRSLAGAAVCKLTPMRAVADRNQAICGVPFVSVG